jgi:hypothetical protein
MTCDDVCSKYFACRAARLSSVKSLIALFERQSIASVSCDDRPTLAPQQLRHHSQAIFFPNKVLNFPNMTSSR